MKSTLKLSPYDLAILRAINDIFTRVDQGLSGTISYMDDTLKELHKSKEHQPPEYKS